MVLYDPEAQRKVFQDEVAAIIEEARKGEVEVIRRHAETQRMSASDLFEEKMLSWVRHVRILKKIASKNKNPDIRSMIMARAN